VKLLVSKKRAVAAGFAVAAVALAVLFFGPLPALAEQDSVQRGDTGDDSLLDEFEVESGNEAGCLPDPLEPMNRAIFRFNEGVNTWVFDPVTRVYTFVVPAPGRRAVHRFFDNLNSPGVALNDLFQFEWKDVGVTTARFVVNSTIGIGGLFDPASSLGLDGHYSDFGQTLALFGVPSGPYLIIPVFGPTTLRDGVGTLVGVLFRPTTYLLGPADQFYYTTIYGGGAGVVSYEQHAEALRMLRDSSIDFYAALRGAYYQSRTAEIYRRREAVGR